MAKSVHDLTTEEWALFGELAGSRAALKTLAAGHPVTGALVDEEGEQIVEVTAVIRTVSINSPIQNEKNESHPTDRRIVKRMG
jgi:hypothetical protein